MERDVFNLKKVELLEDLLELAFSLSEKSDRITEFFGADEIEFLDDEEKMLLRTIFNIANVTDSGHRLHLEDRFYDYLFGKLDVTTMAEEILNVHSEIDPNYRELLIFDDEEDEEPPLD